MPISGPTGDDEFTAMARRVSNWGRWGTDDARGTLNLVGLPGQARPTAGMAGRSVSLARPLSNHNGPEFAIHPAPVHFMMRTGESAPADGFGTSADWIGVGCHGFGVTHIDALSHVFWNGKMYNGVDAAKASTSAGSHVGSVEEFGSGVVTRGVLLDVPRARGVPWLDLSEAVTPDDLDRCERNQQVEVATGDTVYIRTGIRLRQLERGRHSPMADGHPGLDPSCIPWLRERDIAILGSDSANDVVRPGERPAMPVHVLALVFMGMPLVDNADLEELATACAEGRSWTFWSVLAPLLIRRGTGSPVNPLAVF